MIRSGLATAGIAVRQPMEATANPEGVSTSKIRAGTRWLFRAMRAAVGGAKKNQVKDAKGTRHRPSRRLTMSLTVLLAALGFSMVASGAALADATVTTSISPSSVAPGGSATITYSFSGDFLSVDEVFRVSSSVAGIIYSPANNTCGFQVSVDGGSDPGTITTYIGSRPRVSVNCSISFTINVSNTAPAGPISFSTRAASMATEGIVTHLGDPSLTVQNVPVTPSITLSQSASQTLEGQPVTFTATVDPADATGSVTFKDGTTTIGTATLASGVATLAVSNLSAGSHVITAVYSGDSNHTSATSATMTHNVVANGTVVLRVETLDGDGTFAFSSATPGLSTSVTTSGGAGQSVPVPLNPGTYSVTESLPPGFGLTGISCSGAGSSGNIASRSATIVLAAAETVTCTFSSANSRKKTVEVISRFLSRRADLLLNSGPDGSRQIDRLLAAGGSSEGARSGIASNETGSSSGAAGGSSVATAGGPPGGIASRMGLGATTPRPFAQRLSDIQGTTQALQADADAGVPSPMAANGSTEGGTQVSFATSLSKIRTYEADGDQRKVAAVYDGAGIDIGRSKLPTPRGAAFSPFDIWTEGHYTEFGDNRGAQDSNGHFGIFYLGADYVISPSLLIGVLVQYDSTELSSRTDRYSVSGSGWMAGPYATVRLSENVFFQGRAAWGTSDNTISPFATYSDSFHTDRWLVSGTLTGLWNWGPWAFRPTASLAYIEDGSAAYTDTLGVVIPDVNVSLGQFKAGPEVSYKYELSTGATLVPYLGLNAIWNFDASNNTADFGGTLAGGDDIRGQVELGLKSQFANGAGIDFSVSYDGIGSDAYHATSGRGVISVPLN